MKLSTTLSTIGLCLSALTCVAEQSTTFADVSDEALAQHTLSFDLSPQLQRQLLFDIAIEDVPLILNNDDLPDLLQKAQDYHQAYLAHSESLVSQFDFMMNKDNVRQLMIIMRLINVAVDDNLVLPDLASFGIYYQGDGTYQYNFKDSPHLVMPFMLFKTLVPIFRDKEARKGKFGETANALVARGFRRSDADKLYQYIESHDLKNLIGLRQEQCGAVNLAYYENLVSQRMVMDPKLYARSLNVQRYANKRISNSLWRQWGVDLLALFDSHRQRVLKSYLMEKVSGTSFFQPDHYQKTLDSVDWFEQAVESKTFRADLQKSIAKLRKAIK